MGTYCTISDVWEQININQSEMTDDEIEKRITEAEYWINNTQDTTYSGTIPDMIKYATACYAAGLVLDFLFTTNAPNESIQSRRLIARAKEYLHAYNSASYDPESGIEKINSEYFD